MQREREEGTDRQTDRQTDRDTDRERQRETERQRQRKRDRERESKFSLSRRIEGISPTVSSGSYAAFRHSAVCYTAWETTAPVQPAIYRDVRGAQPLSSCAPGGSTPPSLVLTKGEHSLRPSCWPLRSVNVSAQPEVSMAGKADGGALWDWRVSSANWQQRERRCCNVKKRGPGLTWLLDSCFTFHIRSSLTCWCFVRNNTA